ncbi:TIP-1 family-domain-containing protein [Dipodascopsis uninucleata]
MESTKVNAIVDFINQKLPDKDALSGLDDLVASLDDEQRGLDDQMSRLKSEIADEKSSLLTISDEILERAGSLRVNYGKVKDRLINASYRLRPRILEELQMLNNKLERLIAAQQYCRVIEQVQSTSTTIEKNIVDSTEEALEEYNDLVGLIENVRGHCEEQENSCIHLVEYIEKESLLIWNNMREKLSIELRKTFDGIEWPIHVELNSDFSDFRKYFEKLLLFQFSTKRPSKTSQPEIITAFEVMAEPLDIRFRYHFESNRETNQLDKPEWFFSHFLGVIQEHEVFMQTIVQGILSSSPMVANREAIYELIYAYLPSIRRKLRVQIPIILSEPQLLSHLMLETMKFDDNLRETYLFCPYGLEEWQGITEDIMSKREWFESWLNAEKDFALARYQTIVSAEDAWVIEFDSKGATETKPTKSAMRLRDLLETITERYRPLRSFVHRIRFLMDIQITIIDSYHKRITASLDAFDSLTSSIVRAVSGVHEEERKRMVDGLAGIERLCRAYGSAYSLLDAMNDWNEDIFFLELYEELNRRASQNSKKLSRDLKGINSKLPETLEDDDGSMFDEAIKAYDLLRIRTENMIIKHLQREIQKAYKTDNNFRQMVKDKEISSEVLSASEIVSEMLLYLSKATSQAAFVRITRTVNKSFKL